MSTRSFQPGDPYGLGFTVKNSVGALVAADSTPVATVYRNGTVDGTVTVTVTTSATGNYAASATLPNTYAAGDRVSLFVAATVGGVATGEYIDHTRLVGYPNNALPPVAYNSTGGVALSSNSLGAVATTTINGVAFPSQFNNLAIDGSGRVTSNSVTGNVTGSVGAVTGSIGGDLAGKVLGGGAGTLAGIGVSIGDSPGTSSLLARLTTGRAANLDSVDGKVSDVLAAVAGVNTAVGTANTALSALATNVTAVNTAVGGVNTAVGTANTALTALATNVTAVKAVTDKLGTSVVLVSGQSTYQFTATALALAPAGGGGGGGTNVNVVSVGGTAVGAGRGFPAVDNSGAVLASNAGGQPVVGKVLVDQNYGGPGALAYYDFTQAPVGDGRVRCYRQADYQASRRTLAYVVAEELTDSQGNWRAPMVLDPGNYVLVYFKEGVSLTQIKNLTATL